MIIARFGFLTNYPRLLKKTKPFQRLSCYFAKVANDGNGRKALAPMAKSGEKFKTKTLLDAYRDYLGVKKLKITRQRMLIVEEFFREGAHISADDLFRKVKNRDEKIGLASVYRTLKSLVESGLAVERRFLDKTSVFEYNNPAEHHDHLICMRCHQIIEFENEEIEKLQEEVAKKLGFRLIDHKLELYAVCLRGDCAKRTSAR